MTFPLRTLFLSIVILLSACAEDPVTVDPNLDTASSDAVTTTDTAGPSDTAQPEDGVSPDLVTPKDTVEASWCESVCENLKKGCPGFTLGDDSDAVPPQEEAVPETVEECVVSCEAMGTEPCTEAWSAVQDCVSKDTQWVCDDGLGAIPTDGSCMAEIMAINACGESPTPTACDIHCPGIVAAGCGNSPPNEAACIVLCESLAAPPCGDAFGVVVECMGDSTQWACSSDDDDSVFVPGLPECQEDFAGFLGCAGQAQVCADYCAAAEAHCTDDNAIDFGDAGCVSVCLGWAPGDAEDTDGDSLACRMYHVTVAGEQDPEIHCLHASPDGGGVCVDASPLSCDPNPCLNDGLCVEDEDGTIACDCVDGYSGVTCEVEPQPSFPGDSCENPLVIDPASLPTTVSNDTGAADEDGNSMFTNTYTYCNGSAGSETPDVVYAFTPDVTGSYPMTLSSFENDPNSPSLLSVVTDCSVLLPEGAPSCLGGKDFYSGPDTIMVTMQKGETYFFIVDSHKEAEVGPFELDLGEVCVKWDPAQGCLDDEPPVPGGACNNPEDLAIVDNVSFQSDLQTCVMSNMADLSGVAACLVKDTGLTGACADCWSDNTACIMQNCMMCMTKPGSGACLSCSVKFCDAPMFECSGIQLGQPEPEGTVVINEIDPDQSGADTGQFIELYNAGDTNMEMNNAFIVLLDGASGDYYLKQNLAGLGTLQPGQYAIIAQSKYAGNPFPESMPIVMLQAEMQDGPDGVAIVNGDPDGDSPTIWDTVSYGYNFNAEPFGKPGSWWTPEGTAPADTDKGSLSRCPNGVDSGDNAADFFEASPTPGLPNTCGGTLTSSQLCQSTGGIWSPESCGDYVCGKAPECDAIVPGCNCGEGQSFGVNGCAEDDACGAGGGVGDTHFVNIGDNYFDGDFISIKVGDTVEWTNQGNLPHTVTTDDGEMDSPTLTNGETWSHTFKSEGTIEYYCKLHANMTGTVVVEAP